MDKVALVVFLIAFLVTPGHAFLSPILFAATVIMFCVCVYREVNECPKK